MSEHLITTAGQTYRIDDGNDEIVDIVAWLASKGGDPVEITAWSRQQVLAEISRSAIPAGFPEPNVIIGEAHSATRGWFPETVRAWVAGERAAAAQPAGEETAEAGVSESGDAAAGWSAGDVIWESVPSVRADAQVAILTSRGSLTPSGRVTTGPMPDATGLGQLVWFRWPHEPAKKAALPQIYITDEVLDAAGFPDLKEEPESSADLSDVVSAVFGCQVTYANGGWFTASFTRPGETVGEVRRVHLVLLSFLYLDPTPQRPNDLGIAGTADTETELPEDELAAAETLGGRIAWLAEVGDLNPPLLPAQRPATVGAALLDGLRSRSRTQLRIDAFPVPATVAVLTPRLEPHLEHWRNPHKSHEKKGDVVDVEVDQRAAFLASAGQVSLGHGHPEEHTKVNLEVFAGNKPPYALLRVTTPPAGTLDGLTDRLPLPHELMSWDEPATFWVTTRGLTQLLARPESGGAGLSVSELEIGTAWVWPKQDRVLRMWSGRLRDALAEAESAGCAERIEYIKNIYKAFLGRMMGDKHPQGQRHYQQPVWAATIHADTRARATRYARRIADDHGLYPLYARDIDTFGYRVPAERGPGFLEESESNGKYRIKKPKSPAGGQ